MTADTALGMDAPVKPRGGRTKRVYRCKHCQRTFKRSEHCARHERVHTQERPFPCAYCDRRYARKDLVKRHERSLHAEAYEAAHPNEFQRDSVQMDSAGLPTASDSDQHQREPSAKKPDASGLAQQQASPLTPLTDSLPNSAGLPSDFGAQDHQALLDDAYSGLGRYSPPDSLIEQTQHAGMQLLNAAHDAYQLDFGGHRDSIVSHTGLIPDQFDQHHVPQNDYEHPAKRQRIEIDPLLLLEDERQQSIAGSAAHVPSTPRPVLSFTNLPSDDLLFPGAFNFSQSGLTPGQHQVTTPDHAGGQLVYPDSFSDAPPQLDLDDIPSYFQFDQAFETLEQFPQIQKDGCFELPKFSFNERLRDKICEDARTRMPTGELAEALFPTANELQRFFSGYTDCFHRHFPIIHLPSLDLAETPSPLIFAICSIGAQYRLDRRRAKNLFALAGTMSSNALRAGLPIATGRPEPAPLWIMQTRVLLSLCGIFSGKTNVVTRTIENLGLFAIDYRLRRTQLGHQDATSQSSWEEWISRESSKRLMCGMFIVSNLISTTFGINPGFSYTSDLEFEVLDEEKLWNATSASEWSALRIIPTHRPLNVRAVMADIIFNDKRPENYRQHNVSGFTMLLIVHATNVWMWTLLQVTDVSQACTFSLPSSPIQKALFDTAFATLARCHQILMRVRGCDDISPTWTQAEGPLMFNCSALLRVAYIRLFSNISAFNRLTLLTDNADDISAAVQAYSKMPQRRSPDLTKSVSKAYDCFLAPVKIGALYIRKTAALTWSVEHAVAGWDAALFLTRWMHTIEMDTTGTPPDPEETVILEQLKTLLQEAESDYDGTGSLAGAVAHVWSTFLNDVWVWGVTPRMGNILEQLALAYESNYENR